MSLIRPRLVTVLNGLEESNSIRYGDQLFVLGAAPVYSEFEYFAFKIEYTNNKLTGTEYWSTESIGRRDVLDWVMAVKDDSIEFVYVLLDRVLERIFEINSMGTSLEFQLFISPSTRTRYELFCLDRITGERIVNRWEFLKDVLRHLEMVETTLRREEAIPDGHVLTGKVIRDVYPCRESGFRIVFKDGTSMTFEDAECYMAIMELRGQTGMFERRWTSYNGKVELTK